MAKTFQEKVSEAKAAVGAVSPQQAREQSGEGAIVFVDPRPADAIASTTGLIPGAHNIPLDDIAGGVLPEALSDRSTRVVAACQGGPMGAIAAHELVKLGYTDVRYLDGGTQAWLDAGFETQR